MTKFLLHLTERGYIPDFLIKRVALFLSNRRLAESDIEKNKEKVINLLSNGVVAEKTVDANDQHYEVPPEFFKKVLGNIIKFQITHISAVYFHEFISYSQASFSSGRIVTYGCNLIIGF